MKKVLMKAMLVLLLALGMMSFVGVEKVYADTSDVVTWGDWQYSVKDNQITITAYTGSAAEVVIPSEIDGKKVVGIGDNAFYNNRKMTSITIPNGVMTIGEAAFFSCRITHIVLSTTLKSIGNDAFDYCEITNIELPKGASNLVDECGKKIVKEYGFDKLKEIAKLNFKNTEKIKED